MNSYRNIDEEDLLKSVFAAKKFLMSLHLGPATEEWFSKWTGGAPYEDLRDARSSDDLVAAMRRTGVREAFYPFQDVFAYHGMAQLADDAEDEGPDVPQLYADLAAWGAFQNVAKQSPKLDALKKEIDAYLVIEGFGRVADAQKSRVRRGRVNDPDPVAEIVSDYLAGLSQEKANRPLAEWLEMVIPVFTLLKAADNNAHDNETAIRDLLQDAPQNGRFFLKDMLCRMTGLHGWRSNVMDVPRPIMLYGIEPRELLREVAPLDEVMVSLRRELAAVTQPYTYLDEAVIKKDGFMDSRALGRPTVFFNATARAAQHVANHIPDGKVVWYDSDMAPHEIKPQVRRDGRPPRPPSGMS